MHPMEVLMEPEQEIFTMKQPEIAYRANSYHP